MSGNLLEMVHKHLDQTTIDTMASLLSQSRQTMHSAIDQVVPVLAGGLAQKSSTHAGAQELHSSLDRVDDSILDDVPAYLSTNTSHVTQSGTGILGNIFGAELGSVLTRLAPSTGLGEAGTSSVMKMLAPIVLAVLSRHRRREHLDAGALAQFLDDQRRDVDAALPASMAGLFGTSLGRAGELGEQIGEDRERADRYDPGGAGGFPTGAAAADDTRPGGQPSGEAAHGMHPRHGGGGPSALHREQLGPVRGGPRPRGERSMGVRWLLPLLGLLAMVALAYGLLRHSQVNGVDAVDPAVHGVQEERPGEGQETPPPRLEPLEQPSSPEGATPGPDDPDGESNPGGGEEGSQGPRGMAPGTAIEPGSAVEGRVGAVTGQPTALGDDPVHLGTLFGAGSSELEAGPGNRLNALLQLVQDNSEQDVEIRGYAFGADTGDTRELAQTRAEAVRDWLVDNGVDPNRIEAVGGGTSSRSQIDVFLR